MKKKKKKTAAKRAASSAGKQKRQRMKLHEFTKENDIRYRGPLSYRALMILGWLCIALSPAPILIGVLMQRNPEMAARLSSLHSVLNLISGFSLPALLIANFAKILNNEGEYKAQMLLSGGGLVGIAVAFDIVMYRYLMGTLDALIGVPGTGDVIIRMMLNGQNNDGSGFIAFNVFIDLFLCQLFMFFMNYTPKRVFTGRKKIIFRLFSLLPLFYEIGCIILKAMANERVVELPFFVFPLLTVKPPMTFVLFVVLVLFVKRREIRFCKKGGRSREEYQEFLQTNRNSLHVSVFLAICLLLTGFLDLLALVAFTVLQSIRQTGIEQEMLPVYFNTGVTIGLGGSVALIPLAPFLLLFSYTRKHKSKVIDALIPCVAIGLALVVCLEGMYQGLRMFDVKSVVDTDQILTSLRDTPENGVPDPDGGIPESLEAVP